MLTVKQVILRVFFSLEIIAFILVYIFGAHGYMIMRHLTKENAQLSVQIQSACHEVMTLEQQIHDWNTTSFYKEKFAREHLQMAREGEIVYYTQPSN